MTKMPGIEQDARDVTRAFLRAAARLDLTDGELAAIPQMSPALIEKLRFRHGRLETTAQLTAAIMVTEICSAAFTKACKHEAFLRQWLRRPHAALGARPVDLLRSPQGMAGLLDYLESPALD